MRYRLFCLKLEIDEREVGLNRILQWFRQRANSLRNTSLAEGSRRTVRTVETIECEQHIFLVGSVQHSAHDACPLCGKKLIPDAGEDAPRQLGD